MLTKYEAIGIAKHNALKYRLSWSENNLHINKGQLNGVECYVVSTLDSGMDKSDSWLDFEFSSPVNFYISINKSDFLAYSIGNREPVMMNIKKT